MTDQAKPEPTRDPDIKHKRLNLDPDLADGQHWTIDDSASPTLMESIQLWMDEGAVGDTIEDRGDDGPRGRRAAGHMSTEANDVDVLVYGTEEMFSLATDAVTNSIYSTLPAAFAAAVRAGYEPTHWRRADAETVLALPEAEHWRSLMARGAL